MNNPSVILPTDLNYPSLILAMDCSNPSLILATDFELSVANISDGNLKSVSIFVTEYENPLLILATENFQFVAKLLSLATENLQFVAIFTDGFMNYVAILATEN